VDNLEAYKEVRLIKKTPWRPIRWLEPLSLNRISSDSGYANKTSSMQPFGIESLRFPRPASHLRNNFSWELDGLEMNDSHNISERYDTITLPSSSASDSDASLFAVIRGPSFENINVKEFLVSETPFQNPKNFRILLSQNHPRKPDTVPEVFEQTRDAIITPSLSVISRGAFYV